MNEAGASNSLVVRVLTAADLPALADAHIAAFPASLLAALGHEVVRRYYEWQMTGPHKDVVPLGGFQGEELVGFCVEGRFAGALSGFVRRNSWYLALRTVRSPRVWARPRFAHRLPTALRALRTRGRTTPRPPIHDGLSSLAILSIGVRPLARRQGVGSTLLGIAATEARQRGYRSLTLTVHPSNVGAVGFYESLGWQKDSTDGLWTGTMSRAIDDLPT